MEADPIREFRRQEQLRTDIVLKAAITLLLPPEANIDESWEKLKENCWRGRIQDELKRLGYVPKKNEEGTFKDLSSEKRCDLVIETARCVANGMGRLWSENQSQEGDNYYPALEFECLYKREPPETSWNLRWQAACIAAKDYKAQTVFNKTGRMVALKSSEVWQQLGDGAGGYDDALGNKFPPFAVDSGFDTSSVSHKESEELGLIEPNEPAHSINIPSPEDVARRFITKLSQYLAKLEDDEQYRRNNPLVFGTGDELLNLATEKFEASDDLTHEQIEEIKSLTEMAVQRGIKEDDESLIEIYEAIGEPQKADICRQAVANRQAERVRLYGEGYFLVEEAENLFATAQELTPEISKRLFDLVEKAFEKGVGAQFNLRARAHKLLMKIYDRLQESEKAENNRLQYVENASGFMLLNDAQAQLKNLGKQIELETGAKILDMLTKAVQRIPEDGSDKHAEAYRATAEVLEAIGDIPHAIEYYEFALQKNPKIHVSRRLNSLKKKNVSKLTA